MQYETCRHVKEDGTYCGSPALQNSKYCHHHLIHRGRRLRRARALRDNVPYSLNLPPLEDLAAVQVALSEIVHALGAGQLDHRAAGKMLYAIQQTTSVIKLRAQLEAAHSVGGADANSPSVGGPQLPSVGNCGVQAITQTGDPARVLDYPAFEQEFGITAGEDIDAETHRTLRQADEAAELRQVENFPAPPPGMRIGSPQYKIYREECYQGLNMSLNNMRHELREYHEMKRKELEKLAREAMSGIPEPLATSA